MYLVNKSLFFNPKTHHRTHKDLQMDHVLLISRSIYNRIS